MRYRYDIRRGVQETKTRAKKFTIGIAAAVIAAVGMGVPAFAANDGGGYCVNSANGCEHAAAAGAQCDSGAGSGAFGAFGEHGSNGHDFGVNNPGTNGEPGADGHQTGLNNSALCGNRQGNL
jgi:hypothetical protein